jgi:putative transposase
MLPKEPWLHKLGIDVEWPCWGKMVTIHMDNAKEFRGNMIRRACDEYHIDPVFRAVKKPRYGAYIERYLGTVANELKSLPGATFSSPDERGCYDSDGNAALTFSELERYLVNFIVGDYHQRMHSELNMSPIAKWEEGVFGTAQIPGRGLPPFILDKNRLRLDFLPYFEHTIQADGVVWDYIHYYDDVFRHWYGVMEPDNSRRSLKHRFHYNPRDISLLFFYDRKENRYFQIPYRDPSKPPMSKWERDASRKELSRKGIKNINEELIFATHEKNRKLVENAVKETTKERRERQRKINHTTSEKPKAERAHKLPNDIPAQSIYKDITPFDDVDA